MNVRRNAMGVRRNAMGVRHDAMGVRHNASYRVQESRIMKIGSWSVLGKKWAVVIVVVCSFAGLIIIVPVFGSKTGFELRGCLDGARV